MKVLKFLILKISIFWQSEISDTLDIFAGLNILDSIDNLYILDSPDIRHIFDSQYFEQSRNS